MGMKTEAALLCMIASNPTGGERPQGWQKRVNDFIRAQRDATDAAEAEVAKLREVLKVIAHGDVPDPRPPFNWHDRYIAAREYARVALEQNKSET